MNKMNNLKHTPGPWMVIECDDDAEWLRLPYFYVQNENLDIAEIHDCDDMSLAEAEANARLIAAAPEMLESLINCCMDENWSAEDVYKIIEKATGLSIEEVLK